MSYSNQTFQNFQFSPRSPTRRIASAGTAVDMSLVHSYQQNTTVQSPAGHPYTNPSYVGTPTSATSTNAPYSRYNPSIYSQAQASTSSLHQQYPPQSNLRRPSVSPRRSTEGYNPRDYGVLTGREAGVATPIIPDPEDAPPPPPYSPPAGSGSQRRQPTPLSRTSWNNNGHANSIISPLQTPLSATAFSPTSSYMTGSSANTTPLSPYPNSGMQFEDPRGQRREYTPASPRVGPAPRTAAQQLTNIPPPPPGPPPSQPPSRAVSREREHLRSQTGFHRDMSPHTPSALRNESPMPDAPPVQRTPVSKPSNASRPPQTPQSHHSRMDTSGSQATPPRRESSLVHHQLAQQQQPQQNSQSGYNSPTSAPKRKMSVDDELGTRRDSPRRAGSSATQNGWSRQASAPPETMSSPRTGSRAGYSSANNDRPTQYQHEHMELTGSTPVPAANSQFGTPPISPENNTNNQRSMNPARQLLTPPPSDSNNNNGPPTSLLDMPSLMVHTALQGSRNTPLSPVGEEGTFDPEYTAAIKRHNDMINAEAFATSDEERLRIFTKFVREECKHRSRMYPVAVSKLKVWLKESGIGFPADESGLEDAVSPVSSRARFWDDNRTEHSRGRTPSRWWDGSVDGSGAVRSDGMAEEDQFGRRYKRRSSLREIAQATRNADYTNPSAFLGSSAYPPEKVGRPEGSPAAGPSRPRATPRPVTKPRLIRLDVLPLLTLLPPYPPQFPAVSNSHPRFASYRDMLREMKDMSEIEGPQRKHEEKAKAALDRHNADRLRRRTQHSEQLQRMYASGQLSFKDLDHHTKHFDDAESAKYTQLLQTNFEEYESTIVSTVHALIQNRISFATQAFDELKQLLNPPLPAIEATEETPTLQETLTLLKWIFDLLESLYAQQFTLLNKRTEAYSQTVLAKFHDTRYEEAKKFFATDADSRRTTFEKEQQHRANEFHALMESHVLPGIETLMSAFWDLAPLVATCLEKIPEDLSNVIPIVPQEDAHENPAWVQEPMRYLEEKLGEAEKGMRRFVEGKTELFCLLHEVRCWGLRLRGESEDGVTQELKEKVRMIEEEWEGVIGGLMKKVQVRVSNACTARVEN